MEFKVGQKVWASGHGNGFVTSVESGPSNNYPIEVKFGDGTTEYTRDGYEFSENPLRSLFHGHDLRVTGEVKYVDRWIIMYKDGSIWPCSFVTEKDARDQVGRPGTQYIKITMEEIHEV